MNKFKLGDKVRKISKGTKVFPVGYEGEVTGFTSVYNNHIYVDNNCHSNSENWELVEDSLIDAFAKWVDKADTERKAKYPNGKHLHHDVILEYAKGAEIEFQSSHSEEWLPARTPAFSPVLKYRVKPQQDPAVQAAKKKIEQAEQMLREANDELDRLGL